MSCIANKVCKILHEECKDEMTLWMMRRWRTGRMTLCSNEDDDGEHFCARVQELLLRVPVPKMTIF